MATLNRTVTANASTYVLVAQSGEPAIVLCDTALFLADSASPGAGETSSLPANTRHPHSGRGKLFAKAASGTPTIHVSAS